jgi:hypothetical protein
MGAWPAEDQRPLTRYRAKSCVAGRCNLSGLQDVVNIGRAATTTDVV